MLPKLTVVARTSLAVIIMSLMALPLLDWVAESETIQADRWVQTLSVDELDAAVGALDRYPVPLRKRLVGRLAPSERSQVWRQHLQTFNANHRDLSDNAERAISRLIAVINDELYIVGSAHRTKAHQEMPEIIAALESELSDADLKFLLSDLGDPQPRASLEPLSLRASRFLRTNLVLYADTGLGFGECAGSACTCSLLWGTFWNCPGQGCYEFRIPYLPCTSYSECGPAQAFDCDGCCSNGSINN
jgi:hypothetical protein